MRKIVLLGAYSAIVFETAKIYAAAGSEFVLLGRNTERLESVAADLKTRGASLVNFLACDLADLSTQTSSFEQILSFCKQPDLVILGYGILGDQIDCQESLDEARAIFETNFISASGWCEKFAKLFEANKKGTIAVISSVAGDRGRKSNYIYGSSKAALSTYLQGLRNRLSAVGVQVLTIKPGFVDTPMTSELKKGALFASAEVVGKGIHKAIESAADIVYLPWFWRWIMFIIKSIPEKLFKRLSI
jgi:decaprenylphospho-beta-D-erythro-pentofuranosid-2-ulose 2-reductase